MKILVLGVGNILLRDEGVGVRIVESLLRRYDIPDGVEVLDGGTAGMDLLYAISGHERLIVCDAVQADAPPGSVIRISGEDVPVFFQTKLSPHQVGLCDVLATLRLQDEHPATVVIVGVVPEDIDLGIELSETVAAAAEDALAMVVDELAHAGVDLRDRSTRSREVA